MVANQPANLVLSCAMQTYWSQRTTYKRFDRGALTRTFTANTRAFSLTLD